MKFMSRNLAALLVALTAVAFTTTAHAEEKEIVGYRLQAWKTVHADTQEAADKQVATLKKIGCEVKTDSHGDHVDVTYRCVEWKQMALPTHKAAHQWEAWLKAAGFETKHEH